MNIRQLSIQYKIAIFSIILIIFSFIYSYFFPKYYSFTCRGSPLITIYNVDSNEQVSSKVNWPSKEDLIVKKYLFGIFYTLDYYSFSECSSTSSEISCSNTNSLVEFNKFKASLNKQYETIIKKNNQRIVTDIVNFNCDEDDDVLK